MHVLAPTRVGPLQWLATDEDQARAEAAERASEAGSLLSAQAGVRADGEAGEPDPVQAVEDALRSFPADEIMLVGEDAADEGLEAELRRFGLPLYRVPGGGAGPRGRSRLREATRGLASGRSGATPFVLFAGVNLVLLLVAASVALVALLVLWLL